MNPFVERYKKLTNEQLIDIIMQPDDYQELALQTAEEILSERGVTDEEKNTYIQQINEIKEKEAQKKVKPTPIIVEQEILDTNSDLLDSFKKVNTLKEQDEHIIRAICIVYGGNVIFQFYNLIKSSFDSVFESWRNYYNYSSILIIIMTLACFYLLWQKQKLGWQSAVVYFVINIANSFISLYQFLTINFNAHTAFSYSITHGGFIRFLLVNTMGSIFSFLFLIKPKVSRCYDIGEGEEKKMIVIGSVLFIAMNLMRIL